MNYFIKKSNVLPMALLAAVLSVTAIATSVDAGTQTPPQMVLKQSEKPQKQEAQEQQPEQSEQRGPAKEPNPPATYKRTSITLTGKGECTELEVPDMVDGNTKTRCISKCGVGYGTNATHCVWQESFTFAQRSVSSGKCSNDVQPVSKDLGNGQKVSVQLIETMISDGSKMNVCAAKCPTGAGWVFDEIVKRCYYKEKYPRLMGFNMRVRPADVQDALDEAQKTKRCESFDEFMEVSRGYMPESSSEHSASSKLVQLACVRRCAEGYKAPDNDKMHCHWMGDKKQ